MATGCPVIEPDDNCGCHPLATTAKQPTYVPLLVCGTTQGIPLPETCVTLTPPASEATPIGSSSCIGECGGDWIPGNSCSGSGVLPTCTNRCLSQWYAKSIIEIDYPQLFTS